MSRIGVRLGLALLPVVLFANGGIGGLSEPTPDANLVAMPHAMLDSVVVAPGTYSDSLPPSTPLEPPPDARRYPAILPGERLTFSLRFGKVPAGEAVLAIEAIEIVDERPCYRASSTAASSAVFDPVYPVRDRITSWMDVDSLVSRRFEKHLREGRYRQDQVVRFEQEAGRAVYHDGREFSIPPATYDVIAAFQRLRTLPLEVGRELFLDSHADRKNYPIKIKVVRRERLSVPAGEFSCLVIEPTLKSGAFFKGEGKLTIWLTDDARRIPVQMKSKIPVGSIAAVLTCLERPDSPPPSAQP